MRKSLFFSHGFPLLPSVRNTVRYGEFAYAAQFGARLCQTVPLFLLSLEPGLLVG